MCRLNYNPSSRRKPAVLKHILSVSKNKNKNRRWGEAAT
jgi:hypothetical protein